MQFQQFLSQAAIALTARWGPEAGQWPIPGQWPSVYTGLAPAAVVNLCGGIEGETKWSDVSEKCAKYTVKMLQCSQACGQSNRLSGFGDCMGSCTGGDPQEAWCDDVPASAPFQVKKQCHLFVGRWNTCEVGKAWATADEWFNAVDSCVYNCETSLATQNELGQPLSWRKSKCPPVFFACMPDDSCAQVDSMQCVPPLGYGAKECF